MELEIGKKIYQLRLEKGYTQDALAQVLNVSCAAISKWENGYTNPDIATLPILARIFDISIDTLFNFEKKLSEEQVIVLLQSLPEKFQTLSFENAMKEIKALVRTYPNSEFLKLRIVSSFMNIAMLLNEEETETYIQYAISLCEQIMNTENILYRQAAAVQLSTFLSMEGKYEEALNHLQSIPKIEDTTPIECMLHMQLKEYEKAKKCLQTQLYSSLHTIGMNLYTLLTVAERQDNQQDGKVYIELIEKLGNLFHIDLAMSYQIFVFYAKQKDKANTLAYLKKYVKQACDTHNSLINTQQRLSSCLWFASIRLQPKPCSINKHQLRRMLEDMSYLKFLRDDSQYQDILNSIS